MPFGRDHIPSAPSNKEILLARKDAKPRNRFTVDRTETGQKGRFDLKRVAAPERQVMLRRAEKFSKARPSNELRNLFARYSEGARDEHLRDIGGFEARNQYYAKQARRRTLENDFIDFERILLRLLETDRYFTILNVSLRRTRYAELTHRPESAYEEDAFLEKIMSEAYLFRTYLTLLGWGDHNRLFRANYLMTRNAHQAFLFDDSFVRVMKNMLNTMIEQNSYYQPRPDFFYRVSRVLRDAYFAPYDFLPGITYQRNTASFEQGLTHIDPGDIIADWGMLTATHNFEELLFQYSREGKNITDYGRMLADEEEVIFVIKNSPALKYMDTSGIKVPKHYDKYNSGEILIKSNTRFRVLAIQDKPEEYPRRVVHIEPVDEYYENDIVRNMYDGSMIMGDEI